MRECDGRRKRRRHHGHPQLTCSAPPKLTASTGIDALAHAIESYIGLNANPTSSQDGGLL
jgi:alcohol dehydrogenase YqhD (iron-dependent ADH family)